MATVVARIEAGVKVTDLIKLGNSFVEESEIDTRTLLNVMILRVLQEHCEDFQRKECGEGDRLSDIDFHQQVPIITTAADAVHLTALRCLVWLVISVR